MIAVEVTFWSNPTPVVFLENPGITWENFLLKAYDLGGKIRRLKLFGVDTSIHES